MSAADHLGTYAEGWTKGDANTLLRAASESYTLDDPNTGKITKSKLAEYVSGIKQTVQTLRGGNLPDPFMEFSEIISQEKDGVMTAWCWWSIPGTDIKGSGLLKIDADGVRSEVLAYYTKLPG